MDVKLSGRMISTLVGVTASQFLLGFSFPNQEAQILWWVQVGLQSPEGITTIRGILRRFNDFLKLFSEVRQVFPKKNLPPAPPKGILKIKSQTLLEERRYSLEDWMGKLLSDIDVSRSAPVATFLELEAAVRSSFYDENQQTPDANSSIGGVVLSSLLRSNSDVSGLAGGLFASDYGNDTPYEISEVGTPRRRNDNSTNPGLEKSVSEQYLIDPYKRTVKHGMFNRKFIQESLQRFSRHQMNMGSQVNNIGRDEVIGNNSGAKPLRIDGTDFFPELGDCEVDGHVRRLSTESVGSDLSSVRGSEMSNTGEANYFGGYPDHSRGSEAPKNMDSFVNPDSQLPRDLLVALPSDERYRLNRVLVTMQRRLATAKTDFEDLIARLNQEVSVRQFLTTKVKDLEVESEITRQNCKDNMQQAVLIEKEKLTQMQWDMEELHAKCLEMELKLKLEQDEKVRAESTKISIVQENKMLLHELDVAREQLENLQKQHEEFEVKSKADVKLLVKEVKSLRSSQLELKQELSRLMKEKLEAERSLQKERQRMEHANTANTKFLHECGILGGRLQECSLNFLVEEEDKLTLDTSSPSDAIDLLTTSDNRIGLLLAEAQLLAQDVENAVAVVDESRDVNGSNKRTTDDELRKMLTDVFVENAGLRKQVNSVIRCALNTNGTPEQDDEDEEVPLRKTVLSKFLER
ncbi:PX domain-containing protein EREX-like isoform X2 [Juglans microcarpa x Juglans regia]|uniref:PX domain-containing protein EREX-like isoform X2 n=1 Tax=Juglans microcarpa x Juglans regia TaxID=2249226 RepID=UPI001B7EE462|nr:PX domain-containing protein EREX-like isoform X2 [Juglans microcarpa x Juglans regia]